MLWWSVAGLAIAKTIRLLFDLRFAQRLPRLENSTPNPAHPKVSVGLPARNEEACIETSVRKLLAQENVDLEIIAVNDRSSDQTAEILNRLAQEDARLVVIHVEELPLGWLGKWHACDAGAALVTGDWILFTDADVWLKPDVIARAILVADRDNADHICLTPGVAPGTASGQAWHPAFLLGLVDWFKRVNQDKPKGYLGMGAFNLVRTAAYRASGGYKKLRLTVVDDVKLGLLLRRAGKRTRGFIGGDDAECHWPAHAFGMIKIMEKNYFAILDYRVSVAVGLAIALCLFWLAGLFGPFTGSLDGTAAGVGLVSFAIPSALIARKIRWSVGPALLVPLIIPLGAVAVLNSAIVTLRQGGVIWRESFYPLDLLRRWNVR